MFLPVVRPEIAASLNRELINKDDDPYINEQLDIIDDDNPVIGLWIREYSKTTDDPVGAMYCALMVYKLLESQAESNHMTSEIKLG